MSDSQNVPKERVRIFNRAGLPVAEFQTQVERSWVIGDEGRARFYYANRNSDIVNENVLQFGNWLLVQNSLLPAWVGVIDAPRRWQSHEVEVSAYTPQRVFEWRRGPIEEIHNQTPGALFTILINKINSAETTILRPGNIYQGVSIQETLNPTLLSRDLQRIYERSGEEYTFRPVVDSNGRLAVYCDWLQTLGESTQAILQSGEGGNLEDSRRIWIEDDPIVNDVLAYGDGETWASKPLATAGDVASQQKYGLRQSSEEYSGVTNVSTLETNAIQKIAETKEPIRTGKVNAINIGDTFKYIGLGNRLTLRFEKVGFTGTAKYDTRIRIIGMQYKPEDKNKIELVIEELL